MIVVVGAGVIGVTTAYYLARAGHQVTVLERASAAADGCSFANAGILAVGHAESWAGPAAPRRMVRAVLGREPSMRLTKLADPALWRWGLKFFANCSTAAHSRNSGRMLRLSLLSRALQQEIDAQVGFDYAQSHDGAYYLYKSETQFADRLKSLHRDDANRFLPQTAGELIAADPALAVFAGSLSGGLRSSVDAKGDCRAFTRMLADWLGRNHGVRLHCNCTVTGFETGNGGVRAVMTTDGRFGCSQIVLAAGTETPKLARLLGADPAIYPVKGYSATYPIVDGTRVPALPFIDETDLVAVTRLDNRLRVTAVAELAGHDRSVPAPRAAHLDAYVRKHFEGAVAIDQASHWAGLRPTTPSGVPYIGCLRTFENVWINAGQGQLGWTMAAGAGRVVADLIDGAEPPVRDVSEPASWLVAW